MLDDAPHGTSLDNPTCAFRNKKFEMGVLELVLLQCLKGIWSADKSSIFLGFEKAGLAVSVDIQFYIAVPNLSPE